jgi:zinc protease
MFVVGAFDVEQIIPLLARYVGSLPGRDEGSRSTFKDVGIKFPSTIERATVEMGREPASRTVLSFFADPPFDPVVQERIVAATTVLETILRDVLREELGQTYTVGVGLSQDLPQRGGGHIQVSFGSAPDTAGAMTERILQEVKRLQETGPSEDLTNRAKEAARRGYETALETNAYWLRRLATIHMFGGNPADIVTREQRIAGITPQVLQATFKEYFPPDRYTVVTLAPAPQASR